MYESSFPKTYEDFTKVDYFFYIIISLSFIYGVNINIKKKKGDGQ